MASSGALRQKLHVQRRRDGLIVVPALVVEVDLAEMLRDLGFLNGAEPDRQALADALSRWIYGLVTRHNTTRWPTV